MTSYFLCSLVNSIPAAKSFEFKGVAHQNLS
jgi:hypothetical protein